MNELFHGPHGASRSYLFQKTFLLLLALDAWALMIGHAGRYGAAGFNVAHFDWLDAIQPVPTNAWYIGVLLLGGFLSLTLMLTGISRLLMGALWLLYTYSWAMSLLDSYQHHYFVSITLACMVFFPKLSARDVHPPALGPAPESEGAKKRHARELSRVQGIERRGWVFCALAAAIIAIFAAVDGEGRIITLFLGCAAALAACVVWVAPKPTSQPVMTRAFGWNLLGAAVCVVYLYTALAKTDPTWLDGHTIQRIGSFRRDMQWAVEWAGAFGISAQRFWSLFATLVVPQELFMAAAYLCAVLREREPSKLLDAICWIAVGLGVALHVGAEAMQLEIGWFSHYMLLFAATYLLPLPVVDKLAIVLTWPGRYLLQRAEAWQRETPGKLTALLTVLGSAAAIMAAAHFVDLPGALAAGGVASVALIVIAVAALRRGLDPRRWGIAAAGAAALMWLAIAASPVRWDYYRYRAGDLDKRGELEAALEAYEHSERYAPPGETRQKKIDALRRKLKKD